MILLYNAIHITIAVNEYRVLDNKHTRKETHKLKNAHKRTLNMTYTRYKYYILSRFQSFPTPGVPAPYG